jgi:hypothetical protein
VDTLKKIRYADVLDYFAQKCTGMVLKPSLLSIFTASK